jgi:uncharacterized membrane protein YhaH (DUF805 family)
MHWYIDVLQKYAVFSGRARRAEYWFFVLFNFLISIGLAIVDAVLGLTSDSGFGPLQSLYGLAVFVPSLAVSVRRLHDTNRTGWWLLIALIPIVGAVVLLIFMVTDSDAGANQYGPNPKEASA